MKSKEELLKSLKKYILEKDEFAVIMHVTQLTRKYNMTEQGILEALGITEEKQDVSEGKDLSTPKPECDARH